LTPHKRVLLPEPIESQAIELLERAGLEPVVSPDRRPETVRPLMAGAHGLILRTGIEITRKLLSEAGELCIISRTGAGLDNVDMAAATEKQIIVTSNLGVNTISVVEHVLAFMLALSKRFFLMDRAVREGNFAIRYKNLPGDLRGKTLGLLGFGRIGSEVGRVCHHMLGMEVIAVDPFLPEHIKETRGDRVTFVDMKELFSRSDVVSIHVPLTADTHHLVGEREISWMKPEAFLINTSRGLIVNEAALIEALKNEKVAGAGLDVFNKEPIPEDSPLLGLKNVILTPHSAALTRECVSRMATEAARCIMDLFKGLEPPNVANREVLDSERWRHLIPRENNAKR
jgi:D-3-phosphoglycerate dehydrogenase